VYSVVGVVLGVGGYGLYGEGDFLSWDLWRWVVVGEVSGRRGGEMRVVCVLCRC